MEIRIISENEKADEVLKKLVKKKQRGVKITGAVIEGKYNAVFVFNKMLSLVSRGFEKYVRPQQEQFIKDHLKAEGLTKKDYEVIIK